MRLIAVCCGLIIASPQARAHPGLQHDIEKVTEAIDGSPNQIDLLIKRARLYRLDHQPLRALDDLKRAAKRGATPDQIARERAFALADSGQTSAAETAINAHLKTQPADAKALAFLGSLCVKRGDTVSAIRAYRQSVDAAPNVETVVTLGWLLEKSQQLDAAAKLYRTALTQLGKPVVLIQALVDVETERGRFDAAMVLVNDMIQRVPVSTEWWIKRAEIHRLQGAHDDADTALETALTLANQSLRQKRTAIHLCSRAEILLLMDRFDAAMQDVDLAIELAPRFQPAKKLREQIVHKKNQKAP